MLVIFLDGESKSGKTAVGRSIFDALGAQGHNVRLLVAGNFFRQLTLFVLNESPSLDAAKVEELETAVRRALSSEALLYPPKNPELLESDAVEALVSRIGQLSFVQEAAVQWRVDSAQQALDDGVDILLFDGRNLRHKLKDWTTQAGVGVALELVIYCRAEVAAARYLGDKHITFPSSKELINTTEIIQARRDNDRNRADAAYTDPENPVPLVVGTHSVDAALAAAWDPEVPDPPRPIRFDNSEVPRADGLKTVMELAEKAVSRRTDT